MLTDPAFIHKEWPVPLNPDVRVRLTERPGINLYTSVEVIDKDTSIWSFVENSARGHGDNLVAAEERVQRLLAGGWREWVKEHPMQIPEILKRPYARTFLLNDKGVYTALILEFPGCVAQGQTLQTALDNLEGTAEAWLRALIAQGSPIPEPFENERQSIGVLQRLWAVASAWQQNFPKESLEKLSRDILKILQVR